VDVEGEGKELMNGIPGVKEATEVKQTIDQVKNFGKVVK